MTYLNLVRALRTARQERSDALTDLPAHVLDPHQARWQSPRWDFHHACRRFITARRAIQDFDPRVAFNAEQQEREEMREVLVRMMQDHYRHGKTGRSICVPKPAWLGKGISPAPVYEGHCSDGTVIRMSFWSEKKKHLDIERGRRITAGVARRRGVILETGFIEHDCSRFVDSTLNGEVVAHVKPRARNARTLLKQLLTALESGQDWRPIATMANQREHAPR